MVTKEKSDEPTHSLGEKGLFHIHWVWSQQHLPPMHVGRGLCSGLVDSMEGHLSLTLDLAAPIPATCIDGKNLRDTSLLRDQRSRLQQKQVVAALNAYTESNCRGQVCPVFG